jgi:hypothetical protein
MQSERVGTSMPGICPSLMENRSPPGIIGVDQIVVNRDPCGPQRDGAACQPKMLVIGCPLSQTVNGLMLGEYVI